MFINRLPPEKPVTFDAIKHSWRLKLDMSGIRPRAGDAAPGTIDVDYILEGSFEMQPGDDSQLQSLISAFRAAQVEVERGGDDEVEA